MFNPYTTTLERVPHLTEDASKIASFWIPLNFHFSNNTDISKNTLAEGETSWIEVPIIGSYSLHYQKLAYHLLAA